MARDRTKRFHFSINSWEESDWVNVRSVIEKVRKKTVLACACPLRSPLCCRLKNALAFKEELTQKHVCQVQLSFGNPEMSLVTTKVRV
jgi:hypothetical protein